MTRYTVRDLQQMCRDKGVKGFSRKKKGELIEMLGLGESHSMEKVIRDVHDILFPEKRIRNMETRLFSKLQKELERIFEQHRLMVFEKRGSDFILQNGRVLSIRGSLQEDIPLEESNLNEFANRLNVPKPESTEIKNWITQYVHILLPYYLEKIYGDYLLWIDEKMAKCKIFIQPRNLFFRDLTFTRRIDEWKNKNTVKTGKIALGDFVIVNDHIRFSFKSKTLFRLLSDLNSDLN